MNCRIAVSVRARSLLCAGAALLVLVSIAGGAKADTRPVQPSLGTTPSASWLHGLLPADVLLIGEQHDAPDHQQRQRDVLDALLSNTQLSAVVLEMAESGNNTQGLTFDASEERVRNALKWPASAAAGWEWSVYGPLVMLAVRSGVTVWGGNLPRSAMRQAMQDPSLDQRLPPEAWQELQTQIREGHCQLLPEAQVVPMTRVQVARDLAMASAVEQAVRPGKTVLLVAGNQHVRRDLGVPLHWSGPVKASVVVMTSKNAGESHAPSSADQIWSTEPVPRVDHCEQFKQQMAR